MKKNIKDIDTIDIDELLDKVEADYNTLEQNFLQLFQQCEDDEENIPVFDFEIN
jgi:cell division septum initiation protein DivIVA